jgi:hypothetical protein
MSDGVLQTGKGLIRTKAAFADIQLHVEFATPAEVKGNSQERGNSGVFLAGVFEIQVLDSFDNPTYADGQAAAMYGQFPPLVNASRKPGEWQSYDISFSAPKFNGTALVAPAIVTVFHNGVRCTTPPVLGADRPSADRPTSSTAQSGWSSRHGNLGVSQHLVA